MRLNPLELLSRLNSSYWFVPLLVTLAGAGLAVLLVWVDASGPLSSGGAFGLLHPNTPEGSRALLTAIIGAIVTALSVTFSVTIVALTVAAQHFGPRVLNKFVRHTSAQLVLGTFTATLVYSVLVLGAIEGSGADTTRMPNAAVAGAVLLVLLSIGALIFYVHHIATALQIGELTSEIALDFGRSLERLHLKDADRGGGRPEEIPEAPPDAAPVAGEESGYVQRVDYAAIVKAAEACDAVVWIRREPGAFAIAGTPLALVHPPARCTDALVRTLRHACILGRDRTLWHDPEFAVKQLVEVALRALSPGVNEPFTATSCIDRLTEGLARALTAPPPPSAWYDSTGRARLFTQPQDFAVLLRASFDPIRIFAGANPAIYGRLLESLTELRLLAGRPADRAELRHQVELIRRTGERAVPDPDDRAFLEKRYRRAVQQFEEGPSATRR